ncbi:MAG TPA: hypothetical protein VJH97_03535 [Candidatus Nanoarchaeia archaeon]|nr:hypothetical protein [Candidatus Nanoarchaeia archaeon]
MRTFLADLAGIRYCVLRNYDFLLSGRKPAAKSEFGLDMVVAEDQFSLFSEIAAKHGFKPRKPQFSLRHKPFFKIQDGVEYGLDVQVGGICWNDIYYLGEKFILKNRVKRSFFYVPGDDDTYVMLLLHSLLGKRYFKPEYKKTITSLSPKINRKYVHARLADVFGERIATSLLDLSVHSKFEELLRQKASLIGRFIVKHPIVFAQVTFRWLWGGHVMSPLIAVIGPDGSGKSTTVRNLAANLGKTRKVKVIYSGRGRDNILPLKKMGSKYKQKELAAKEQNKSSFIKRMLYTIASGFYAIDLCLRYVFVIFPARLAGNIVITDRYVSDIFLMQHVPYAMRRLLLFFFPKPNLTFYLYNTPDVLLKRRAHDSINLKYQLDNFRILNKILHAKEIKTTDIKSTADTITQESLEWLACNWY